MQVGFDDVWEVIRWREKEGTDSVLSQQLMWFEESNEFLVALNEWNFNDGPIEAVWEELADTIIMLWHVAACFGYAEVEDLLKEKRGQGGHVSLWLSVGSIYKLSVGIRHLARNKYTGDKLINDIATCIWECERVAKLVGLDEVRKVFSSKLDKLMRKVKADEVAA